MTTPAKRDEANTPDAPERARVPWWSLIASGIWIVFGVGLWVTKSNYCQGETWIKTIAACSELNEFGDFLAGIFAPLAFCWLAGAVFIQSKELGAQRRELALTREELKMNREVASEQAQAAREQAEAARRSADTFEQQTRYSDTERRLREQETADRELQTLITPVRALHQSIQPPAPYVREMSDIEYALHFGRDFGRRLDRRIEDLISAAQTRDLSESECRDRTMIIGCAAVAAQLRDRTSDSGRLLFDLIGFEHLQLVHWFENLEKEGDDNSVVI